MVGVLAVGFVANLLIRQVADRFHEPDRQRRSSPRSRRPPGGTATRYRHLYGRSRRAPSCWWSPGLVVGTRWLYGIDETS